MPSFVGVRYWCDCQHFTRGAGVLAVGFVIEVAPATRRDMEKRGQAEEENKERAPDRRRLQGTRVEESFVEREGGIA